MPLFLLNCFDSGPMHVLPQMPHLVKVEPDRVRNLFRKWLCARWCLSARHNLNIFGQSGQLSLSIGFSPSSLFLTSESFVYSSIFAKFSAIMGQTKLKINESCAPTGSKDYYLIFNSLKERFNNSLTERSHFLNR